MQIQQTVNLTPYSGESNVRKFETDRWYWGNCEGNVRNLSKDLQRVWFKSFVAH